METLSVLEKKVVSLIDTIRQLKAENARLVEENVQLETKFLQQDICFLLRRLPEHDRWQAPVDYYPHQVIYYVRAAEDFLLP